MSKLSVLISPDFTAYVGRGACDLADLPSEPLIFGFGDFGEPAVSMLSPRDLSVAADDHLVILAISRTACLRLLTRPPKADGRWYLPSELRGLGRAVVAVEGGDALAKMLRVARSQELLCQLLMALKADRMVEIEGIISLTEIEISRIAAAHQLVSERWQEKLTVSSVARHCGIGKGKLTRGFRELYRCTVAEAVIERRLQAARQLLAQSDLQISSIGYRCGYMSNASFTRAFARRFGMAPTLMRRSETAA